jgi:hypothetical protein
MSVTPGWIEKNEDYIIGVQALTCDLIRFNADHYFIDNGSEYKHFPRTQEGWEELCETLKSFAV